jgi:S-adenosylmethionine synthetase
LQLNRPIYQETAAYGHFGRQPTDEGHFPWEKLDLIEKIQKAFL